MHGGQPGARHPAGGVAALRGGARLHGAAVGGRLRHARAPARQRVRGRGQAAATGNLHTTT